MQLDDPEAAVACDVAEVAALAVDRGDDDALPGVALDILAVGRAILIVGGGEECLDLFDVGLFHASQLTDLHGPEALQLFRSGLVIHVRQGERFRVILGVTRSFTMVDLPMP